MAEKEGQGTSMRKGLFNIRKLSKSDVRDIIRMRKQGIMTRIIARRFGVCECAIDYHIYPNLRNNRKKYIKKYIKNRYNNDGNFRKRHLETVRKYQEKNYDKIRKQQAKYRKMKKSLL